LNTTFKCFRKKEEEEKNATRGTVLPNGGDNVI